MLLGRGGCSCGWQEFRGLAFNGVGRHVAAAPSDPGASEPLLLHASDSNALRAPHDGPLRSMAHGLKPEGVDSPSAGDRALPAAVSASVG